MTIKIGFIGAQGVAHQHAKALGTIPDALVTHIFDPDPKQADRLAGLVGAQVCRSVEACMAAVDAVYVLTEPASRRDAVLQALAAGTHVFCETPLAASLEDAAAIVSATARAKVKAMAASTLFFSPGFQRLRQVADSGQIGEVRDVWSQLMGGSPREWHDRRGDGCSLGGTSLASLTYEVSFLQWLAGDPDTVRTTTTASDLSKHNYNDTVELVFTFNNGKTGRIQASWSSQLRIDTRGLAGTAGCARIHSTGRAGGQTLVWKTIEQPHARIELLDDEQDGASYAAGNRHFIDCILHDETPLCTVADAVKALEIALAARTSERLSRQVAIPEQGPR